MADEVAGVAESFHRSATLSSIRRAWQRLPLLVQAGISWIPGGLVFFRAQFTSGFDRLQGDSGDVRLIVSLHEHWVEVLRGRVSWTSPEFFFPVKGTLGYSDTFFLNQVFYAPLRAVGLDEFLAFQWTIMLLSVVGFCGMYVLLRRVVGVGAGTSFALASAFAFANNLYIKAGHPQLYSVHWLPLLVLVAWKAVAPGSRRAHVTFGAATGALLGVIIFSTYYIGWFVLLVAVVMGIFALLLHATGEGWRQSQRAVISALPAAISAVVGLAISLVPFVSLYLPVLHESGGRQYEDAMFYAPSPQDAINVGPDNYLWGSLNRRALSAGGATSGEVSLAVTPLLALSALAAGVVACRRLRRGDGAFRCRMCIAGAASVITLTVLPIRFSIGSLWRIPWVLMPGASGIRAIDRLQIVTGFVAVLTMGLGLGLAVAPSH